jgi:hypothetical protein
MAVISVDKAGAGVLDRVTRREVVLEDTWHLDRDRKPFTVAVWVVISRLDTMFLQHRASLGRGPGLGRRGICDHDGAFALVDSSCGHVGACIPLCAEKLPGLFQKTRQVGRLLVSDGLISHWAVDFICSMRLVARANPDAVDEALGDSFRD